MMIFVMGHIKLASGDGEKARALFADHMAAVAAEDGCDHYSFAFDAADPDTVRIAERWADEAALAAHGQAAAPEGVRAQPARLHRRIDQREGV